LEINSYTYSNEEVQMKQFVMSCDLCSSMPNCVIHKTKCQIV